MPDAVVSSFAAALGIDMELGMGMDIDDAPASIGTKGFDGVRGKVNELMRSGYSAAQLLSQVGPRQSLKVFSHNSHRLLVS